MGKSCLKENVQTILIVGGVVGGICCGLLLRMTTSVEWTERKISYVGFPGEIFLSMQIACTIPLMMSFVICAVGSLDLRVMRTIGGKAVLYYASTAILAIILTIILSVSVQPGRRGIGSSGDGGDKNFTEGGADDGWDLGELDGDDSMAAPSLTQDSLMDVFRNMFPRNVIMATMGIHKTKLKLPKGADAKTLPLEEYETSEEFVSGMNIMGLMIFSIALGLASAILRDEGKPVLQLSQVFSEAMMILTGWIVNISPVGVFFLLAAEVLRIDDFEAVLISLGLFVATTLAGFMIHSLVVLPLIYFICVRKIPFKFILNMGPALIMTAATSSSLVSLPVTLRCLEGPNRVDSRITRFLLPIGATLNLDGMALYEAAAVLFIAQLHNANLTLGGIVAISLTATAASIGSASMPQSGIFMTVTVLHTFGLPASYISYILPADWLLDRLLTSVNCMGDSLGAAIIHHVSKNTLNLLENFPHDDKQEEDGEEMETFVQPKAEYGTFIS